MKQSEIAELLGAVNHNISHVARVTDRNESRLDKIVEKQNTRMSGRQWWFCIVWTMLIGATLTGAILCVIEAIYQAGDAQFGWWVGGLILYAGSVINAAIARNTYPCS